MGKQPNQYKYSERVAKRVREMAPTSSVASIFATVSGWVDGPGSLNTFYKYYRDDLEAARGKVTEEIGNIAIENARKGDYKFVDLYLTTKGGWKKGTEQTNIEGEQSQYDDSVLENLYSKLLKPKNTEEEGDK